MSIRHFGEILINTSAKYSNKLYPYMAMCKDIFNYIKDILKKGLT
jgi:hypothetical protein